MNESLQTPQAEAARVHAGETGRFGGVRSLGGVIPKTVKNGTRRLPAWHSVFWVGTGGTFCDNHWDFNFLSCYTGCRELPGRFHGTGTFEQTAFILVNLPLTIIFALLRKFFVGYVVFKAEEIRRLLFTVRKKNCELIFFSSAFLAQRERRHLPVSTFSTAAFPHLHLFGTEGCLERNAKNNFLFTVTEIRWDLLGASVINTGLTYQALLSYHPGSLEL